MIRGKSAVLAIAAVVILSLSAWAFAAAQVIDHRSMMSGIVLSTVAPGAKVPEGAVLVTVGTLTGQIPASRATTDGIVREVLVHANDNIRQGDLVVRIEPTRK